MPAIDKEKSNKSRGHGYFSESDQGLLENSTIDKNPKHGFESDMGDSKDDFTNQTYRNAKEFLGTSDFETQIIIVASLFGVALLAINIITIICW